MPEQIERLAILFPDLVQSDMEGKAIVLMNTPVDDPRVKELLDEAQQNGIDIWQLDFLKSGFGVSVTRNYDSQDLDGCRHLHSCEANSTFLGEVDYPLVCDSIGIPALRGKPRQKTRMFGNPEPLHLSFFVARGEAKWKLEAVGFKGLRFHPVEFNRVRRLQPEDQLWAVWSDLILPPVKNLFRADVGEMGFADDLATTAKNMSPAQGFLSQAELHYRREDIEVFGEFDVALMREPIKIHGTATRNVVFSQRFRRFVIDELGVPFSGIPVRLDDDGLIPWAGPYPSQWSYLNQRPEWLEKMQEEISGPVTS